MPCGRLEGLLIRSVILPCLACSVLTLNLNPVLAALSLTVAAAGRFGVAPATWVAAVAAAATAVTATAAASFFECTGIASDVVMGDRTRGSTHPPRGGFALRRGRC